MWNTIGKTTAKFLDKRERILAALILLGCLFRVLAVYLSNPLHAIFSDPARHWENGQKFLNPHLMGAIDPFLYQLYIFLLRSVTRDGEFGIFTSTSLLSLLVPYTWYRFSREVLDSKNQALLATALITWVPSFVFIYSFFMTETLLLPLLGASLWFTARAKRKESMTAFMLAAVTWALTAQTRIIAFPIGVMSLGFSLWSSRRLRLLPPCLLLIALFAIPQAMRSYSVLGFAAPFGYSRLNELVFISGGKATRFILGENGDGGYLEFGNPALYLDPFYPFFKWNSSRTGTEEARINIKRGREDWDREYQRLREKNRHRLFTFFWENLVFMLFSHSWPDSATEASWLKLSLYSRFIWAPLILFNLFACTYYVLRERMHLLPLVCLFTMALSIFQIVAIFEGRYRKPLELLLVVSAVFLLNYFWRIQLRDKTG